MEFGVNFFPTVSPAEKSAAQYYEECLHLVALAEELGYAHVKTVEHYFFPYGGYSPDPVTFLAAAAARTERIRLITGAAIPAFTHPVKLAGKLAMLDNLSHGRLDVGFGRAFLPDEFEAFGIPLDESRERFAAAVEACRRLWSEENVTVDTPYFRFGPATLLPRPYQSPHPRILVAAAFTAQSCETAGTSGYGLMLVPSITSREKAQDMIGRYRAAWTAAGHRPGGESVHLSYDCYLDEDGDRARRDGRVHAGNYQEKLSDAVQAWGRTRSTVYEGYERLIEQVKKLDYDESVRDNKILAGDPQEVLAQLRQIRDAFGEITVSLHTNAGLMPVADAERTMRLFAEHVMPELAGSAGHTARV
ncbi:LLM class flavin-dependent oxidoreductase [Streptomyces sp. NPDC050636]|uniref:LLM class flavin-dependent oxidoreductase n=1 Tax=Streptomyces sp. NPDC050636 TaxID=3154510 RepID=UPI0034403BD1